MTDRGEFTPEGIRFERRLPAPPSEIWEAITGPDRLAEWLERTDLARHVGGPVTVHFEGSPVTGTVQVWEPPSVLEYTWVISGEIESVVRFELEPDNGGTACASFTGRCPPTRPPATRPVARIPRSSGGHDSREAAPRLGVAIGCPATGVPTATDRLTRVCWVSN